MLLLFEDKVKGWKLQKSKKATASGEFKGVDFGWVDLFEKALNAI